MWLLLLGPPQPGVFSGSAAPSPHPSTTSTTCTTTRPNGSQALLLFMHSLLLECCLQVLRVPHLQSIHRACSMRHRAHQHL
jgi:hypothetical protein